MIAARANVVVTIVFWAWAALWVGLLVGIALAPLWVKRRSR